MACNYSHSFRHYTPPTVTLQIYNPQSFWGRWPYQSFPEYFSFQLQFDDPRKGEQGKIIGDRTLLEKLRKEVNAYIQRYLATPQLLPEGEKCDLPPQQDQGEYICISRESEYSHRLYYKSWEEEQETLNIVLSSTQLLDLLNALEAYYYDVCESRERKENISSHLGLSILITSLVFTGVGGWWWYYERELTNNPPLSDSPTESNSTTADETQNFHQVLPPTPLDEKKLPQPITPKLPEKLQNQPPLPPPPPIPPTPLAKIQEKPPLGENKKDFLSAEDKKNPYPVTPSPPKGQTSRLPPNSPTSVTQSSAEKPKLPVRLSKLPVLSPSSDGLPPPGDSFDAIPSPQEEGQTSSAREGQASSLLAPANDTVSDTVSNLDSLSPLLAANRLAANGHIIAQIKDYFSSRWQPPESLKQSVQYRLEISPDGSVTKITPIGQVAVVYLDKTGMPLLGEKIAPPLGDKTSSLTIRLILSPDGTVQAFVEESKGLGG